MSKQLKRNILIVCEGEVTEPEYFARLRVLSYQLGIWDNIEIKPKPRGEEEHIIQPNPHKSPRPQRKLKTVIMPPEADETEERLGWRRTPVRYVKEARDGLKDNTYEEAWAVLTRMDTRLTSKPFFWHQSP